MLSAEDTGAGPSAGEVLVIDDDLDFAAGLADLLQVSGYRAHLARDREQAIEILGRVDVDAALVDIRLGTESGIDLIGALRTLCPDTAFICMTAYASTETAVEALQHGAYDYLRKPFHPRDLEATLQRAAERSRLQRERETAEQALRDSERRFRDLVEGSIQGVLIHRRSQILFINQALAGMLGYDSPQQMAELGVQIEQVVAPHDRQRVARYVRERLDGVACPPSYELDVLRRDGSIATLRNLVRVIDWQGEPAVQATLIDVTESRRAREELEQHRDSLEELVAERTAALQTAVEGLESFSYSVSHDLRAPLRSIEGLSRIVLEDYRERLDDTGRDYLERICAATQRMDTLVVDLLALASVDRSELSVTEIDLDAVVQEVADRLREGDSRREVALHVEPGMHAVADPRLMRVVIENLLGNAWKYTRHASRPEVRVGRTGTRERPVFYVRDNGVGFEMIYAEQLFEPFQRLHPSSDYEGSGIGLATVARVLRRHGGKVWAEGRPEQGATFYFTLPRRHVAVATAP